MNLEQSFPIQPSGPLGTMFPILRLRIIQVRQLRLTKVDAELCEELERDAMISMRSKTATTPASQPLDQDNDARPLIRRLRSRAIHSDSS